MTQFDPGRRPQVVGRHDPCACTMYLASDAVQLLVGCGVDANTLNSHNQTVASVDYEFFRMIMLPGRLEQ